jgi:hypothetical protein
MLVRGLLVTLIASATLPAMLGCGEKSEPAPAAPSGDQAGAAGDAGGGGGGAAGDAGGGAGGEGDGNQPPAGGGGGAQGATDRQEIERNLATVVSGSDPELVCDELATERFIRSAYGSLQGCRDAVAAQRAVDVRVVEVTIDDSRAGAIAIPGGGPSRGDRLEADVVLEDGVWKVDSLRSNAPPGP